MTAGTANVLQAAIRAGRDPKNWSKNWTDAKYGVAEHVAQVVRDSDTITLERANEELTLEGWEPLGPDLRPFPWGPITAIHRIGDHAIVEAFREDYKPNRFSFHSYTIGPGSDGYYSTSHSFRSLDDALLHCIVFAAEWRTHGINAALNERLTNYLRRTLGTS